MELFPCIKHASAGQDQKPGLGIDGGAQGVVAVLQSAGARLGSGEALQQVDSRHRLGTRAGESAQSERQEGDGDDRSHGGAVYPRSTDPRRRTLKAP